MRGLIPMPCQTCEERTKGFVPPLKPLTETFLIMMNHTLAAARRSASFPCFSCLRIARAASLLTGPASGEWLIRSMTSKMFEVGGSGSTHSAAEDVSTAGITDEEYTDRGVNPIGRLGISTPTKVEPKQPTTRLFLAMAMRVGGEGRHMTIPPDLLTPPSIVHDERSVEFPSVLPLVLSFSPSPTHAPELLFLLVFIQCLRCIEVRFPSLRASRQPYPPHLVYRRERVGKR